MNNSMNVSNVLTKSHPKSVIKAFLVGSKEFENLFGKYDSIAIIDDSSYHVTVLQIMNCSNYVIVEYVSEDEYMTYINKEENTL